MDFNVYKYINNKYIIDKWKHVKVQLNSASGHEINSYGKVTINMFIDNHSYAVDFILTRGFKFDILLGSDFIYKHKAVLDISRNTMIINKKILCLRPKNELKQCCIVEATSFQQIEPYSITYISVRSKNNMNNTCIISPLDNSELFKDQPGLNAPCITVKSNTSNRYVMPIVNNTGMRYVVRNKSKIGFIEAVNSDDSIKCVDEITYKNIENTNNSHVSSVIEHNISNIIAIKSQLTSANPKKQNTLRHVASAKITNKLYLENNTDLNVDNEVKGSRPYSSYDVNNLITSQDTHSLQDHTLTIGDGATTTEQTKLRKLLDTHAYLFVDDNKFLTRTNIMQAKLNTGDHLPIKQRPYKNPLALQTQLDEQLEEMLEAGIISTSASPWASPVVVVPKKDGTLRVCIDFRKFNQILVKDSFPLPRVEDLFATLGKAKYFSSLDLKSGYWQMELAPEDRKKTAFCTRTQLLEFNVLPFGVASAPSLFQRMISLLLKGIEGKYAVAYLDDILIFSDSFEAHLGHLDDVLRRLRKASLSLNRKKCHFVQSEISYLGHIISKDGIAPDPEKVRAIQTMEPPTTVKGIRSFLGTVGYYRNFQPTFSAIARPLTRLTKKNVHFSWSEEAQEAFEVLKQKLTEAPILAYPDVTRPYTLYTDASDYAIGGILTQDFDDGERVIQYVSHQLTPNRMHYPVIEKECFAIIYCLQKLKQYLLGADVTCYTDHKPLKSLFTAEMKNTRVQRWAILLDEYQVKIKYRQGIHNGRADMLSRLRIKPTPEELEEDKAILAIEQELQKIPVEVKVHEKLPHYADISFDDDIQLPKLQQDDAHGKHIMKQLKDKDDKTTNDYVITDGLLYHIAKLIRFEPDPILQLVIPNILKQVVLEGFHAAVGGGHVGLEKTYQKIRSKYFWPNCYKDVVEYVQQCEVCQRRGLRKLMAELQDSEKPNGPMEYVRIDTVGPFVTSNHGNNYLVTMVDWYSSWVEAYPAVNKEAATIAKVIMERFIPQHGCPSVLISDRGTEYVNSAIDLLSTQLKISRKVTTPYHPSGNGKTERCHRFLNDILAKGLQDRSHDEWEDLVPGALFAMRTCVNDSTKYTPYMVVYGRDPVMPLDTLLTPRRRYYGEDYVPTALQRLHTAFIHVAENTRKAREDYQKHADNRAHQRKFEAGDPVFLHDPTVREGQMRKLCSPWMSHYRIVEMTGPVTAVIRCQRTGHYRTAHVNNLRYANIYGGWDNINENSLEFPEQNTRKLLKPQRKQPVRKSKMLPCVSNSRDYHSDSDTVIDSSDDDDDDGVSAKDAAPPSRGFTFNNNFPVSLEVANQDDVGIQRIRTTTVSNRYNLRSRPGEVTTTPLDQDETIGNSSTDDLINSSANASDMELEVDEDSTAYKKGSNRERSDSNLTIIYNPDDLMDESEGSSKRKREQITVASDDDSDDEASYALPSKRTCARELPLGIASTDSRLRVVDQATEQSDEMLTEMSDRTPTGDIDCVDIDPEMNDISQDLSTIMHFTESDYETATEWDD